MNMQMNQELNGANAQDPVQQRTLKAPYQAPTVQILGSSNTRGKLPFQVETVSNDEGLS
jgi:hypothetical protein